MLKVIPIDDKIKLKSQLLNKRIEGYDYVKKSMERFIASTIGKIR